MSSQTTMTIDTTDLKRQFASIFGSADSARFHAIRAPGRVNLIGEHTDYNDGLVLPMAIEPHVLVVCRGRDDVKVRIASTHFENQIAEFSVAGRITEGEPKWANYSRGVAAELLGAGIPLVGMDALIDNTLPVGGGLSSSAAIEIGTMLALLTLAGVPLDPQRMALLAQKAEHEFAHVPCGIMDQTIVAGAKAGHAMLLDCRDLSKHFIPIDENEIKIVIVNSMVKHELSGSEYAERRAQCQEGVAHFRKSNPRVKALRDVTMKDLEAARGELSDVVFRRCRHVITEIARVMEFAGELTKKNYEQAGERMVQSHASLRDDYEVSCPELDFLVEESMKIKGVYGARMTGGGFGGCIVALAQPRAAESYAQAIHMSYSKRWGMAPGVFATNPSEGASVIQ
jgi:galactokinase